MKKILKHSFTIIIILTIPISCDKQSVNEDLKSERIEIAKTELDYSTYQKNKESLPPVFLSGLHFHQNQSELENLQQLYYQFLINNDEKAKIQFSSTIQQNLTSKELYSDKNTVTEHCLNMVSMYQAYALTGNENYLTTGQDLLKTLLETQDKSGFSNHSEEGIFFEENSQSKNQTLHGHLMALLALNYVQNISNSDEVKLTFDEGLKTTIFKLREYDSYFTSLYSKAKGEYHQYTFSSAIGQDPDYFHELVILQLLSLYVKTDELALKEFAHQLLKQDMGSFTPINNQSKFKQITSSYSIDKDKPTTQYLDDELWSWGKYWATSKFPTELTLQFNEIAKNVDALTFYSIKENASPNNFNIYARKNGNWTLICHSDQILMRNINYYKTKNYETFISTYYLPFEVETESIKIEFLDSHSSRMIALREINVHFERNTQINKIINQLNIELGNH